MKFRLHRLWRRSWSWRSSLPSSPLSSLLINLIEKHPGRVAESGAEEKGLFSAARNLLAGFLSGPSSISGRSWTSPRRPLNFRRRPPYDDDGGVNVVVMEVTTENFETVMPLVERSIEEADFLALDGEFTGVGPPGGGHSGEGGYSMLDTPEERYSKVRSSTSKYLLVQFGLCTFRARRREADGSGTKEQHQPATSGYTCRAFNFYVWPRNSGPGFGGRSGNMLPDPRFLCQTSSIDFLVSNGFDFNKLFRQGVPYLSLKDEQRLRDQVRERHQQQQQQQQHENTASAQVVAVPEDQVDFMESVYAKVGSWLEDGATEPLVLDRNNAFQRRLIYSNLKARFSAKGTLLFLEAAGSGRDRSIKVSKVTEEEERQRNEAMARSEVADLEAMVGFSRVVRKISQSRKLVVGHNMLCDLCHILHQFVHPLPDTLDEFKELVGATFPSVCDTKLMASTPPLQADIPSTTLEDLLRTVVSEGGGPSIEMSFPSPDDGCGVEERAVVYKLTSDEKYHEAGYDAFVTGTCFVALSDRLAALGGHQEQGAAAAALHPLVRPFLNKVPLARIIDVPYLNLAGEDVEMSRDHVFHVTFPAEWRTGDIQQLFAPVCGPVQVAWINDTSAYAVLRENHPESYVLSSVNSGSTGCGFNVMSYKQFKYHQAVVDTGITPVLEKSAFITWPPRGGAALKCAAKRSADNGSGSPGNTGPKKRNTSGAVDEDNKVATGKGPGKVFQESADWD